MAGTIISLNFPATVSAGTAAGVKHLMAEKSIQFTGMMSGTFSVCTVQIQGSNDNSNWAQIGTDVSTNGFVSVTLPVQYIRLNVTVHSSGTQTATLCGYGPGYSA